MDYRDDQGEKAPGCGVVHAGGGDCEGTHFGFEEIHFCEDSGEDGEGGDGHGYAKEEEVGGEVFGGGGGFNVGVKDVRGATAEDKGEDHAEEGDEEGFCEGFAEDGGVEFEADEEEEEDKAKVGHEVEEGEGGGGEDGGGEGGDLAHGCGAEEDSRYYFGDYGWKSLKVFFKVNFFKGFENKFLCIFWISIPGCRMGDKMNLTRRDMQAITSSWMVKVGRGTSAENSKGLWPDRKPPS